MVAIKKQGPGRKHSGSISVVRPEHTSSIPIACPTFQEFIRFFIAGDGEGNGHAAGMRQACYWDATGMRVECPSPSPTPLPKYTEAQNRHGVMGDTQ